LILFVRLWIGAMSTKAYLRYDLLFSHLVVYFILIKVSLLSAWHRVVFCNLLLVYHQ
jgi:hypothetical protein